ncbi:MAG TPA: DUF1634 domain-containing protein [Methylomirabilota bacterium]|nr:DUF1634 domain-containing protein [Methylomirabilota bacterium]
MALRAETLVARLLFVGGVVSVALMLVGLVSLQVHAVSGRHPVDVARIIENRQAGRAVDVFVSLPQLMRALHRWPPDPTAIMTVGVVVLLLTPALGLAAALVGFVQEHDRPYAIIAAALIAALLFGFALRLGG